MVDHDEDNAYDESEVQRIIVEKGAFMFCTNCGAKLVKNAMFCINCGAKIGEDAASLSISTHVAPPSNTEHSPFVDQTAARQNMPPQQNMIPPQPQEYQNTAPPRQGMASPSYPQQQRYKPKRAVRRKQKRSTAFIAVAAVLTATVTSLALLLLYNILGSDDIAPDDIPQSLDWMVQGIADTDAPVTRGSFSRLVIGIIETPTEEEAYFDDVPVTHPLNVWVTAAVRRDIIHLAEHGRYFGVDDIITHEEAVTWIVRALGIGGGDELGIATEIGLLENMSVQQFNRHEDLLYWQALALIVRMYEVYNELTPSSESFVYAVYRDDITVIDDPIRYSYIRTDDNLVVTVYNTSNSVQELSIGDTFVFEPTANNPGGLAVNITGMTTHGSDLIITGTVPSTLDEIFDEFEFAEDIDILAYADDILIADEFLDSDGIEITRNPTRFVQANLSRFDIGGGVTLDGNVRLYTPRVSASLSIDHINHLVVTTTTQVDLTASTQLRFDRLVHLFTIPVQLPKGIRIDVPLGIRITAEGDFSLEFIGRANAQFGVIQNRDFAQVHLAYSFDFEDELSVSLAVNIRANASVLGIGIYGIQGDFGRGVRTSSQLRQRCVSGTCLVVELFHVRRISSVPDWGVLRNVFPFELDLASLTVSDIRYRTGGRWHRYCPHVAGYEYEYDEFGNGLLVGGEREPIYDGPLAHLGTGMTLDEARNAPTGLFVKDGDMFIPIAPQWINDAGGFGGRQIRGVGVSGVFGSNSNMKAILFDPEFEIPRIPNNAHLVLIGETNIGVYATFHNGWTIPYGVNLGQGVNAFGVPSGGERVALLGYDRDSWGERVDAWFDTINGQPPLNFDYRMVYTRRSYGLMPFHGLLTGSYGEEFTFARWESTDFVERTYVADRRFFTMTPSTLGSDQMIPAFYEIVTTYDGYFEVVFLTPPLGFYGIGSSVHWIDRVVEFVEP